MMRWCLLWLVVVRGFHLDPVYVKAVEQACLPEMAPVIGFVLANTLRRFLHDVLGGDFSLDVERRIHDKPNPFALEASRFAACGEANDQCEKLLLGFVVQAELAILSSQDPPPTDEGSFQTRTLLYSLLGMRRLLLHVSHSRVDTIRGWFRLYDESLLYPMVLGIRRSIRNDDHRGAQLQRAYGGTMCCLLRKSRALLVEERLHKDLIVDRWAGRLGLAEQVDGVIIMLDEPYWALRAALALMRESGGCTESFGFPSKAAFLANLQQPGICNMQLLAHAYMLAFVHQQKLHAISTGIVPLNPHVHRLSWSELAALYERVDALIIA